jgi:predicted secreted protein with PEFG-CTERM motif
MKYLLLSLLAVVFIPFAYADFSLEAYILEESNTVVISGEVESLEEVTFVIQSPSGNIVTVDQITPTHTGHIATQFTAGGDLWGEDGTYTAKVTQEGITETVDIELLDGQIVPEFGVIAMMILVVSITTILLTSKTRLLQRI